MAEVLLALRRSLTTLGRARVWLILLGMITLAVLAAYDKTTHEGER